ncbi:MAG TPA: protein kinase [Kofleriaceae bacterium]|jgi:serine/threonine-protein kinase|nr:protein kinase [Kofleriaceae bacterium]
MEIGSQIGPFVVLRLLGKGGMGSVYLAEHSLMKDLHAIKILDPQLTQNPAIVTRFVNEARAAARLRHRNLVRVHNIERLPNDGSWFMVLDYLDGSTLARFMAAQRGPMPAPTIVHILAQVANCIQHVHDHKIVHRDLKPDNIFLIRHGDDPHFPVVLDLGVAQLSEDLAAGPATKTGTVIGTPIYMAPEQLRGQRVSPAADIFALGVIAYEMSTGGFFPYQYDEPRTAYFELPPTEIYYRQRSGPPVDPRRRCPGLGDAWVDALRAALDPDPRVRPPSAGAFARMLAAAVPAGQGDGHAILHQVARELVPHHGPDLEPHRSGPAPVIVHDAGGDPSPGPVAEAAPVSTLAEAASQSLEPSHGRRRWGLIAAAGLAALVAGGATFAITHVIPPPAAARGASTPPRLDAGSSPIAGARPSAEPAQSAAPPSAGRVERVAPPSTDPPHPAAPSLSEVSSPAVQTPPSGARSAEPVAASARAESARSGTPRPADPRTDSHTRPPSTATSSALKKGELAIIVKPWALIWLNGKSLGQTPFREAIPAGRYRLRIANDDAGKDETTLVTVNPDQTTTVQRSW